MHTSILSLFPPHTHPLTLVRDPDRLLAGETMLSELLGRGFNIIQENDPVLLRNRVEELRPFTPENPLIIITSGSLEDLPYDLYQPAHYIRLMLHQFFPNLTYPVLQSLSPEQIEKLDTCQQPLLTLGRQKTIDYLLHEVFDADEIVLRQPHALVAWLNDFHHQNSHLPILLRISLTEQLKQQSEYKEWDIDLLIRDAQAFQDFVQQQWQLSVDQSYSGKEIKETRAGYSIPFNRDPKLQDLVPSLVRRGIIQPLKIETLKRLPGWAQPGVTLFDARLQRLTLLLKDVHDQLDVMQNEVKVKWTTWKALALNWAELCILMSQTDLDIQSEHKETYQKLTRFIDSLFEEWIKTNYAALGTQRLPKPHQVHHIPHYLAYLRDLGQIDRLVLFVLDGMSLTDWQGIQSVWKNRHRDWIMNANSLLAQVPTITSVSRHALISGLRPIDILNDPETIIPEARAWELFWSRAGISEYLCKLMPLSYDRQIDQLPELQDPRINFWCLIDDTPDKLAHNATLGAADQQSSLRLWLDPAHNQNSLPLENLIDEFLDRGFSVYVASDHGHVEATGFGQPSEGILAQTRGKRARIYEDHLAASRVQESFSETILWENDGLLPAHLSVLMPRARNAFAYNGEVVVTHGGITIEEVVIPFIEIRKARA